jgi:hypothetical protein
MPEEGARDTARALTKVDAHSDLRRGAHDHFWGLGAHELEDAVLGV